MLSRHSNVDGPVKTPKICQNLTKVATILEKSQNYLDVSCLANLLDRFEQISYVIPVEITHLSIKNSKNVAKNFTLRNYNFPTKFDKYLLLDPHFSHQEPVMKNFHINLKSINLIQPLNFSAQLDNSRKIEAKFSKYSHLDQDMTRAKTRLNFKFDLDVDSTTAFNTPTVKFFNPPITVKYFQVLTLLIIFVAYYKKNCVKISRRRK